MENNLALMIAFDDTVISEAFILSSVGTPASISVEQV